MECVLYVVGVQDGVHAGGCVDVCMYVCMQSGWLERSSFSFLFFFLFKEGCTTIVSKII